MAVRHKPQQYAAWHRSAWYSWSVGTG